MWPVACDLRDAYRFGLAWAHGGGCGCIWLPGVKDKAVTAVQERSEWVDILDLRNNR